MYTADRVLATKVGVAPGTTTFQLGNPLCDRGAMAAVQRQRYLPTLLRKLAQKAQDAASAVAPTLVPQSATPKAPAITTVSTLQPSTLPSPTISPSTTVKRKVYDPYTVLEDLKGPRGWLARWRARRQLRGRGLGMVPLNTGPTAPGVPYAEVVATMKNYGPGSYCGTYDKGYHQNATARLYYDSRDSLTGGLGAIPSDLQLSRIRGYTPVMSSWVPFVGQTWAPAPWVPPNGAASPSGIVSVGPPISRLQLAGPVGEEATPAPYDAGAAAVAELKRHQDRVFALSVVSTMAIASTAVINVLKHLEDAHKRKKREERIEPASPTAPIAGFGRARRRRGRR